MVNGMYACVLFDSAATQSFVSLALSKKFYFAPKTLDFRLEVETTDERTVSASVLFCGCVLNLFSEIFSTDLVSISLRGSMVIIGMDWLGTIGAMIHCERHFVRV